MLVAAPQLSNIKKHNKAHVRVQTTLCSICAAQLDRYALLEIESIQHG